LVSGVSGLSGSEVLLGSKVSQGWWVVVEGDDGSARIVAGPFADRDDAGWAAGADELAGTDDVRSVYGLRRPDGVLERRASPRDRVWLEHLAGQIDRLPEGWDAGLSDEDPLITLVVEIAAALSETGLPLYDSVGAGGEVGGACLAPVGALGGVLVAWRQHDRMTVDQVHGAEADTLVQRVMNTALADVLRLRGFLVEDFGGAGGHVVRSPE
jgi:hypothetical protein